MKSCLAVLAGFVAFGGIAAAQNTDRRATYIRGGDPNQGKCTIEVDVDQSAEVTVQGDRGRIRTLAGRPASWRRFECTGPLPSNPYDFRFEGIDGRGRQQLVRDPRSGGVAVVRIEDPSGGSEGYTFDLIWSGGGSPVTGIYPDTRSRSGYPDRIGGFGSDPSLQACGDAARNEAARRYRLNAGDLDIYDLYVDNTGRRDTVTGRMDSRRDRQGFEFTCSMREGRVRSVQLNPAASGRYNSGGYNGVYRGDRDDDNYRRDDRDRVALDGAVAQCQNTVASRLRGSGYSSVDFGSIRTGGNDSVTGDVRAYRGGRTEAFGFSCALQGNNGIGSVDVWRR